MTDKERLAEMFKTLRSTMKGTFARQNFSCCGNCATYEIGTMPKVAHYVFYHHQDADAFKTNRFSRYSGRASENLQHTLYLAFGLGKAHPAYERVDSDDVTAAWARTIVETSKLAGFEVEWDGNIQTRIALKHKVALPEPAYVPFGLLKAVNL